MSILLSQTPAQRAGRGSVEERALRGASSQELR